MAIIFNGPNNNTDILPNNYTGGYQPNTLVESKPINEDLYAVQVDLNTLNSSVTGKLNVSHAGDTTQTHGVGSGEIVGTTLSQILTNKTIDGNNNSISNISPSSFVSDYTIPWSKIVADTDPHTARITNEDLAEDIAYSNINIPTGAIVSDKLAAIPYSKITVSNGAIAYEKLNLNNKITTTDIVSGAVTEDKIDNSAVTENKIATGAVTSAKIADGTIVNADINANAAISYSKLSIPDNTIPYAKLNLAGKLKKTDFDPTITLPVIYSGTSVPSASVGEENSYYFQYTV